VSDAFEADALDSFERRIDAWLRDARDAGSAVVAVDRGEPGERRWYVRLRGDDKDFTTIWLTLGQRTLRYETYVLPAPEANHAEFYEQLLRRNYGLVGAHFAIGPENAVFLIGELPLGAFDEAELDRVVGSMLAFVEHSFRALLGAGFSRVFRTFH